MGRHYDRTAGVERRVKRRPVVHANAIRMKRSHHKGCFLIVEGRDDRLFFEQFVDRGDCAVEVAEDKQSVADAVAILESARFPGVVGVMDGDLDHVDGHSWHSDNLILLETYDLEALLIKSPALDRVLVELGSARKIDRFGKDVREALVDAAVPIGCLRLHSRRCGLNLRFSGMKYAKYIDDKSLQTDVSSLIREVKNRSQRSDLACAATSQEIRGIEGAIGDRWLVCCGTDMIEILGIGLRTALGTNNSKAANPCVLRQDLRLGYERRQLINSRLGRDLREWEERNQGFRVLRDE